MQNVFVVLISIVAGMILGVVSNWIYDILKSRGHLPDRPSLKHTVVVVFAFIPIVFLVALPSLLVSYGLAETEYLSAVSDFSKSSHVEIWLGSLNKEYGLILGPSLDDGQHEAVTVDEVSARQTVAMSTDAPNAYLYFHVDDSFDFTYTDNIAIYVEYFDEGSEPIYLDYDTIPPGISGDVSSIYKSIFLVSRSDSNTWKNAKVTLGDTRFGNHQNHNADFRLSTQQTPLTIRYVRIDKSQ